MQYNDIHLRSGRIVEPIIDDITSSDSDKEETGKEKSSNNNAEIVESSSNKTAETAEPPFSERLALTKTLEPPPFNLLGEFQNLYVKIPLLQAQEMYQVMLELLEIFSLRNLEEKLKIPSQFM